MGKRASLPKETRLGRAIRDRRGALGLDELAAQLGLSERTLARLERGQAQPGVDSALKLARWLGWPMERVIEAGREEVSEALAGEADEAEHDGVWGTMLPLTPQMEEHRVYRDLVMPHLVGVRENVQKIVEYGFTEMLNNAIDHSGGSQVEITVERSSDELSICIADNGEGIFHKIMRMFGIEDIHEAIFELSKGKLTTDPAKHSGQGIFYTLRAFDDVTLVSWETAFKTTALDDLIIRSVSEPWVGTGVLMTIDPRSPRTLTSVFDAFASTDAEYRFAHTSLHIDLLTQGDQHLVSRSQARRVLARLDQFESAVLDFHDVSEIGQAFADEIFRVFLEMHPEVKLIPKNMTPAVEAMVRRAQAEAKRKQV